MRLFAEEKRSGTIELLRTSPVKDIEIVLGKFCASFVLYLTMLATTLVYPFLILPFGKVDIGQIISAYTGMVLLGATFLSFGLMISSMTRNQIVSALTSFGILLVFWIIGSFADRAGSLSRFFKYLSLIEHLNDFTRGVIVVKDVVYYLSFTFICVFFTIKSVESAKWK